jgi:hypothetical protein
VHSTQRSFLVLATCFLQAALSAQEVKVTRDLGTWWSASVETSLAPRWKFQAEHQLRTYGNALELDDAIVDAGVKHKVSKQVRLSGALRFTHNARRRLDSENKYRYNVDAHWIQPVGERVSLRYRLRHEQEYTNLFELLGQTLDVESKFRHRVKAFYEAGETHRPYASVEVHRLTKAFRAPSFSQLRMHLGDTWNAGNKQWDVSIGYTRELQVSHPLNFVFLFIRCNFEL